MRILVGSPVRQRPAILREFLSSILALDSPDATVDYWFSDDNDDPESSALLRSVVPPRGALVSVPVSVPDRQETAYTNDDSKHHWSEALIWRVARLKDQIIDHAIDHGYEYLFLVDSDLVLHTATLRVLSEAARPIISEIYWTRWQPDGPELPQVWCHGQYDLVPRARGERLSRREAEARALGFLSMLRRPGVYKVGGLGACTLIARLALEKGVRFAEIRNLPLVGEDRHFCVRAAALGFDLYVDTHLPAYHIYRDGDLAGVDAYRRRCRGQPLDLPGPT